MTPVEVVASVDPALQKFFQGIRNLLDTFHHLFRCVVCEGKILNEKQRIPHLAQITDTFPAHALVNMKEGSSDKCVRGQVYGIYFECEECLISKTVGLPLQCLDFVVRGFQGSG